MLGFRYFKADMEFTLQINAQPFQQGGLLIWYLPVNAASPQYGQVLRVAGKTGCPSKVYNLSDAHTLKFTVPYTNPLNYIDLVDPAPSPMGRLTIDVYAPLQTGTVEGVLYAKFVNVKLVGPTRYNLSSSIVPTIEAQSGEGDSMIKKESVNVDGPVARTAGLVSDISSMVGSVFPEASIVTMPLSWVSRAVSKVASFFGWSKPVSLAPVTTYKFKGSRYHQNYNGLDLSENMGLDADNSLGQFPLFATIDDEMLFDNIITIFNYGTSFNWSTNDDVNTVLATYNISPTMFDTMTTLGTAPNQYRSYSTTYLGFVANQFAYWNGDIALQFRAFKTNYHSGRLRFIYDPGTTAGTILANSENMPNSCIWDVRTQHTTVVKIPYMLNTPWAPVYGAVSRNNNATANQFNGTLRIVVLNKLVASSVAPPSFRINVEIAGVKGMSFAVPVESYLAPVTNEDAVPYPAQVIPTTVEEVSEDTQNAEVSIEAQLGDDSGMTEEQQYITQKKNVRVWLDVEKLSIGEVVVSFRQLLKKFSHYQLCSTSTPASLAAINNVSYTLVDGNTTYMAINPFQFNVPPFQYTNGSGSTRYKSYLCDLLTTVGSMYAYYRGSVRLKIAMDSLGTDLINNTSVSLIVPRPRVSVNSLPPLSVEVAYKLRNQQNVAVTNIEGILEYQIPFYGQTSHKVLKDPSNSYAGELPYVGVLTRNYKYTSDTLPFVYRAMGDDASFGFLVGVPFFQFIAGGVTQHT